MSDATAPSSNAPAQSSADPLPWFLGAGVSAAVAGVTIAALYAVKRYEDGGGDYGVSADTRDTKRPTFAIQPYDAAERSSRPYRANFNALDAATALEETPARSRSLVLPIAGGVVGLATLAGLAFALTRTASVAKPVTNVNANVNIARMTPVERVAKQLVGQQVDLGSGSDARHFVVMADGGLTPSSVYQTTVYGGQPLIIEPDGAVNLLGAPTALNTNAGRVQAGLVGQTVALAGRGSYGTVTMATDVRFAPDSSASSMGGVVQQNSAIFPVAPWVAAPGTDANHSPGTLHTGDQLKILSRPTQQYQGQPWVQVQLVSGSTDNISPGYQGWLPVNVVLLSFPAESWVEADTDAGRSAQPRPAGGAYDGQSGWYRVVVLGRSYDPAAPDTTIPSGMWSWVPANFVAWDPPGTRMVVNQDGSLSKPLGQGSGAVATPQLSPPAGVPSPAQAAPQAFAPAASGSSVGSTIVGALPSVAKGAGAVGGAIGGDVGSALAALGGGGGGGAGALTGVVGDAGSAIGGLFS